MLSVKTASVGFPSTHVRGLFQLTMPFDRYYAAILIVKYCRFSKMTVSFWRPTMDTVFRRQSARMWN